MSRSYSSLVHRLSRRSVPCMACVGNLSTQSGAVNATGRRQLLDAKDEAVLVPGRLPAGGGALDGKEDCVEPRRQRDAHDLVALGFGREASRDVVAVQQSVEGDGLDPGAIEDDEREARDSRREPGLGARGTRICQKLLALEAAAEL